jgi:hypothetical protein
MSIWEEIRHIVSWKTDRLVESVHKEISNDSLLAQFRGKRPVPPQLREIMEQRANAWVQRLYDSCCDAYMRRGKTPSGDFDRAVWFYRVEPFIMGETNSQIHDPTMDGFLNLLLCAVGSPPEERPSLTVNQKECCFDVRKKVYETWHDKLHHLPPRNTEAAAAMAVANAREPRAVRIVAGLPPDDSPPPPTTQAHPLRQPEELPPPICIGGSAFWRGLANEFLSLQDRLRADSKATDLTNRSFNVLAKQGAFAIADAPDVWVWLGAVMKEDPEFCSSYLDKEVFCVAEFEHSLVMGQIDRLCQLSATFCKKLEDQAAQAEFEENQRNDPKNWSQFRQQYEALKSVRELRSEPPEQISEEFVRQAIASIGGIKPEDVTREQIAFEVAGLLSSTRRHIELIRSTVKPGSPPEPEANPGYVDIDKNRRDKAPSSIRRPKKETNKGQQKHIAERDRSTRSGAPMSEYRSELKRGILMQLIKKPNATDFEISRGLDADGAVELPALWKIRSEDRLFAAAYSNPATRRKVEIAISKVRVDLRKRGLLDYR